MAIAALMATVMTAPVRSLATFSPSPFTEAGSLKIRRASAASIRVTSALSRHGPAWVCTRSSPSGGIDRTLPPWTDGWTDRWVRSGPTPASRVPPASRPSQPPIRPIMMTSTTSSALRSRVPRHHGVRHHGGAARRLASARRRSARRSRLLPTRSEWFLRNRHVRGGPSGIGSHGWRRRRSPAYQNDCRAADGAGAVRRAGRARARRDPARADRGDGQRGGARRGRAAGRRAQPARALRGNAADRARLGVRRRVPRPDHHLPRAHAADVQAPRTRSSRRCT